MSLSNILSSLQSALTSLKNTVSQLWGSLTKPTSPPPSPPVPTPSPQNLLASVSPKPSPTPSPTPTPTPAGAPHPLPGGGSYYPTSQGLVVSMKTPQPQFTPLKGEGTISGDWIFKGGQWVPNVEGNVSRIEYIQEKASKPMTSLYREASIYTPAEIAAISQRMATTTTPTPTPTPTPKPVQTPIEFEYKPPEITTLLPSLQNTSYPSTISGVSTGYLSPTTGKGLTQAVSPLSIANQGLISLLTKQETEKPQFTPLKGEGSTFGNWIFKNGEWQNIATAPTQIPTQPATSLTQQPTPPKPQIITKTTTQPSTQTTQITAQPTTSLGLQPEKSVANSVISQVLSENAINLEPAQEYLSNISSELSKISDLIKSNKITSVEETQNYLNKTAADLKSILDQIRTLPENPVPTDEELLATVDATEQDYWKKVLDSIPKPNLDTIYAKYGIPDIIKTMTELENQILAEATAYDAIIKDIKTDPDFPKALAQRREKMIMDARDINLQALQLKYNFLIQRYNQALDMAKDEIAQQQSQYQTSLSFIEKSFNDANDRLKQLISTGAIANLDNNELNSLAQQTGYTLNSLIAMKNAVKLNQDKYSQFVTREDSSGNLNIIGIRKNGQADLIRTFQGVGTPSGGTLTLNQAQKLGLPTSLVGRSEQSIAVDLNSPTPPDWFRQMLEEKMQVSLSPVLLQQKWEEFKQEITSRQTTSTTSTISTNNKDSLMQMANDLF